MGIKSGDFVIVLPYGDQKVGVKCYPCKLANTFAVKAKCFDGFETVVQVIPMKYIDNIGLKVQTYPNPFPGDAAVCLTKGSYIAMSWIDEAKPLYTSNPIIYQEDLLRYTNISRRSVKCTASCQAPMDPNDGRVNGIEYCINTSVGYPQDVGVNIYMQDVNRSPNITNAELTNMFDLLLAEFKTIQPLTVINPEYVILTVDNSGSMNTGTIQPAYDNLKNYIQSLCPTSNIVETEYSNEQWLNIWYDQIKNII